VDEGADGYSAFEQQFGYVPPGFALFAAGGRSDEDWFFHG
jgi:hypothetical protein